MTWTIKSLLDWTTEYFSKYGIEWPHLEAEILLAHVMKVPRINLYIKFADNVGDDILADFKKLIIRRSKREPLAYITGFQPFMGLDFIITPDVLVPRPETEILIQTILDIVNPKSQLPKSQQYKIFDIGTGSGAIAISLAKYIDQSTVVGIDISEKAVEIAKQNAQKHGMSDRCNFVVGDLFGGVNEKFDIIVSNPPYIPTSEIEKLQPEISKYEPRSALDGGEDGLDYYRKISASAKNYINDDGKLIFEIGFGQADNVKDIISQNGFELLKAIKDYSGIERVIAFRFLV